MNCKQCQTEVHPYAIFPGEICVECYAKTDEANRPITARELAQMWGGKMNNLLDKCAECGEDFYGTHLDQCSKEENLDMCGVCDRFYHNQGKAINSQCVCEREGK